MALVCTEGQLRGFYERAGRTGNRDRKDASGGRGSEGTTIPEGIDWNVHRIASSQRYTERLKDIEWGWTIDDVWDANNVLDLYEEVERKAAKQAKAGRKQK